MKRLSKKLRDALPVPWIASTAIRILGRTLRFEVDDRAEGCHVKEPVIWLFWHNRILMMPYVKDRFLIHRLGTALASPSRDGEMIAQVSKRFGYDSIRGSTNKRSSAALREMIRAVRNGKDMVITPDGPRGPSYALQPGAIKLAQICKAPLFLIHVEYASAWKLKTWDGFLIPKPFTKAKVSMAPLVPAPPTASDEAFEALRLDVEQRLKELSHPDE